METIEERFGEMILHRVQQKEDKGLSQEYERKHSSTQKEEINTPQDPISSHDGYMWDRIPK